MQFFFAAFALTALPSILASPITLHTLSTVPSQPLGLRELSTSSSSSSLSSRTFGTSDTENDLLDGTPCRAMTVIFARGTTELGNVGSLAGPPFFAALSAMIGADNLAVQGVEYPADIPGFLVGGDAGGSVLMAKLVGQAMSQCPDTKVVMSGYSQGGQLVHNAAKLLSASETAGVSSAVIFGDPNNGKAVGGIARANTKIICHKGDNICLHGDLVLAPHLTYSINAKQAASFVAAVGGIGVGN